MSSVYELRCTACKAYIDAGQRGGGSEHPWIYRTKENLDTLEAFFVAHEGHPLAFGCFECPSIGAEDDGFRRWFPPRKDP